MCMLENLVTVVFLGKTCNLSRLLSKCGGCHISVKCTLWEIKHLAKLDFFFHLRHFKFQYPFGPVCDWPDVIDCEMGTTPGPTTASPCNCEPWQDCNEGSDLILFLKLFKVIKFIFKKNYFTKISRKFQI